ncbi:MAG: DUF1617 family protein [Streptococcaceae bacterium]|jgi:Mg/Co/Ni transporter MgtE|nr:DUF1617 family protein [Streptococcaceae bacterium]
MQIRKQDIPMIVHVLNKIELKAKISRINYRVKKKLIAKTEDMANDEKDLLDRYCQKDADGKLVEAETPGTWKLVEETKEEYIREKIELLNEEETVDLSEFGKGTQMKIYFKALENSETKLSGEQADAFNLFLDKLEEEINGN